MKRIKIILALYFFIQVNLISQCYLPFVEKDCYLNTEINLVQNWNSVKERHIHQWGLESSYLHHYDEESEVISSPKYKFHLDSLYNTCLSFIQEYVGTHTMCTRMEFVNFSHSPTRYNGDKIRGEFRFKFYYEQQRHCWNDNSDMIRFKFEEVDSLVFKLIFPEHLPDCQYEEKCQYIALSKNQWIDRAINDGFVDGTEDIDLSKQDFKFKVLSYYDGLCKTKYLFYSLKHGIFVKDDSTFRSANWREHSRNYFRKSELIVDAQCMQVVPFDTSSMWSSKNYYFEVHHVLKGNLSVDTVIVPANTSQLHSISMPSVGKRAILYLVKDGYPSIEKSNPISSNRSQLWYPFSQPTYITNNTNLYTKLLPALADLDSIEVVKSPNYLPKEVSKRLTFLNKKQVPSERGLLVKMDNEFWSFDNSKWISHLYAFSCGDFTYPTELTFDVEYDSSICGSYIVDRGLVSLSHLELEKDDRDFMPQRTLSNNYKFQIYDLEPSMFRIIITAKDIDKLCQVPIEDGSRKFEYKPLLSIAIDVIDPTDDFRLDLYRHKDIIGKHYSPIENKIKDYDYITVGSRDFTIYKSRTQKIDSVGFDTFLVGDTVSIVGQYLQRFKKDLYHPCYKKINNIDIKRHCRIPDSNIIAISDTLIRYIIQDKYDFNRPFDPSITGFKPTSGTVKVKYLQSEFIKQKVE